MMLAVLSGCTSVREWTRLDSPDRQASITVSSKERCGLYLIGPEPPRTIGKWARFVVEVRGRKVHDTGFRDIGRYQQIPHAFDVAWSPDSTHVAYRSISTLSIISRDGAVRQAAIVCTNALISSFKWVSAKEILAIVKEINDPLDLHGDVPAYHGFLAKAKEVKIMRVCLDGTVSERFTQRVNEPTFMFHSIGFENQEISPYSSQVAFGDGSRLCIYDDDAARVLVRVPISGPLEGTWWESQDTVIVGTGLLSGRSGFFRVKLADGKVQDCTATLLPHWDGMWGMHDWFRAAKAEPDGAANAAPPHR